MDWTVPWNLIGLIVSGDIGDLTVYTDRFGKKVAFPKSPPKKPPSPAQTIQRAAFKSAQSSWRSLTDSEKESLESATKKLSIPMTGQNLWIHTLMTNDETALQTVENQSGIPLPTPP